MKKKYPAKISYGLMTMILIILFVPMIIELLNNGISKSLIPTICIVVLVLVLILHLFLSTEYTIDRNTLNVKCSFIIDKNIDITTIKEISKTNTIISSPAPSFYRIMIKYGGTNEIIISPKNKVDFVGDLTKINPDIIHNINED